MWETLLKELSSVMESMTACNNDDRRKTANNKDCTRERVEERKVVAKSTLNFRNGWDVVFLSSSFCSVSPTFIKLE